MSSVGIDLGITHFAADSDGHFVESPHYLDRSLAKVKLLQRRLSRKKNGSKRRAKARLALARRHEKVANHRRDFLHKLSRYYVQNYDVICVENLAVAGMLADNATAPVTKGGRTLHRHVVDAGWRAFLGMVAYKAPGAGKLAMFVDPRDTSRECAACGMNVPKALWDRVLRCPRCGFTTDRDTNASLVIRKRHGSSPDTRGARVPTPARRGKRGRGSGNLDKFTIYSTYLRFCREDP